jgi:hypothetical protein
MPDILHRAIRRHQQGRLDEAAQLYQPIYQRSVARWRNYERSLEPLLAKLPASGAARTALLQ